MAIAYRDLSVAMTSYCGASGDLPALIKCISSAHQVASLQEQLDKGPSAQLTRLQQENSILRDALNQATSQAESK